MQKQRKRKMTFERIEVCFQGSVRAFMEVPSFVAWVHSIPGPSCIIGIQGVGAKEGPDSQELGNFVTSVLRIEGAPGHWRRCRIGFLQKQCGHHLAKEGAVKRTAGNESRKEEKDFSPAEMLENRITPSLHEVGLQEAPPTIVTSEAKVYKYRPQADCKRLRPLPELLQPILSAYSSEPLQHPQQHQQHNQLFPPVSADDGDGKQLSSLEREALRTRGRPWDAPGPRRSLWQCFPIWRMWNLMSEQHKGLVRRKLEF